MSLLLQAMTSDDDAEITKSLTVVLKTSRLGLVHESINVNRITEYTSKCPSFSAWPVLTPTQEAGLLGPTAFLLKRSWTWLRENRISFLVMVRSHI